MTRPEDTTAQTPKRSPWHVADAVVAFVLVVALTIVNVAVGFLLWLGAGLSSDCTDGSSCRSQSTSIVLVVATVLIIVSTGVAYGGVLHSDTRKRLLSWGPVAGFVITGIAWAVVATFA